MAGRSRLDFETTDGFDHWGQLFKTEISRVEGGLFFQQQAADFAQVSNRYRLRHHGLLW